MLSSHTVSRHAMAIDGNISRSAEQRSGAIGEQQWSIQRRVNGKAWAAMTSCSCDGLHQRSPFPLFPATLSRWATIAAMAAPGSGKIIPRVSGVPMRQSANGYGAAMVPWMAASRRRRLEIPILDESPVFSDAMLSLNLHKVVLLELPEFSHRVLLLALPETADVVERDTKTIPLNP
nr:hypothetical protein Iba_chr12bCG8670 [Ipomoea batatas]